MGCLCENPIPLDCLCLIWPTSSQEPEACPLGRFHGFAVRVLRGKAARAGGRTRELLENSQGETEAELSEKIWGRGGGRGVVVKPVPKSLCAEPGRVSPELLTPASQLVRLSLMAPLADSWAALGKPPASCRCRCHLGPAWGGSLRSKEETWGQFFLQALEARQWGQSAGPGPRRGEAGVTQMQTLSQVHSLLQHWP